MAMNPFTMQRPMSASAQAYPQPRPALGRFIPTMPVDTRQQNAGPRSFGGYGTGMELHTSYDKLSPSPQERYQQYLGELYLRNAQKQAEFAKAATPYAKQFTERYGVKNVPAEYLSSLGVSYTPEKKKSFMEFNQDYEPPFRSINWLKNRMFMGI